MRFKVTGACIESELLWAGPPPFERSPSCGLVLPYWWLAGGLGERERDRGRCHGQWRQWMLGGQGRGRSYPGVISRWGHGGANIQTEAVLASPLCAVCRTFLWRICSKEKFHGEIAQSVLRKYKGRMQGFSHALCFVFSRVFRLFARYLTWMHWLHLRLPRERNSWVKRLESVGEDFSRCQLRAQPSDTPPALLGQKSKVNNKH